MIFIGFIDVNFFKEVIIKGKDNAKIEWNGGQQSIFFSKIQVGYGFKHFIICPICGQNRAKLYLEGNLFICIDCCSVKPYNGIQNTTKGGDAYIGYKMERFATRCGIGKFEYPFDYLKHPKPKGKHSEKWNRNLKIMQSLESMRFQSIFFKKIWKSRTIKSVETGKNKYIQHISLNELKRYFFPFDNGV
ncbi:MAG: hypothetical protein M0R40_06775 [Firmicutes bacterium]|nr:hypothetical protein [Bacillota bacterium]